MMGLSPLISIRLEDIERRLGMMKQAGEVDEVFTDSLKQIGRLVRELEDMAGVKRPGEMKMAAPTRPGDRMEAPWNMDNAMDWHAQHGGGVE
jgi:hypothetical protein